MSLIIFHQRPLLSLSLVASFVLSSCTAVKQPEKDLAPVSSRPDVLVLRQRADHEKQQKKAGQRIVPQSIAQDTRLDTGISLDSERPRGREQLSSSRRFDEWLKKIEGDKLGEVMAFDDIAPEMDLRSYIAKSAKVLKFRYNMHPSVNGIVNLELVNLPNMTRRQAWAMFEHILWLNGAYIEVGKGDFLNIMPMTAMTRDSGSLPGGSSNVRVELLSLGRANAVDVAKALVPYLSQGGNVQAMPGRNDLLITDTHENMDRLYSLIDTMDRYGSEKWHLRSVDCTSVPAAKVYQDLLSLLPVLGIPVTTDVRKAIGGSVRLTFVNDTVVLSAATPEVADYITKLGRQLDTPSASGSANIYEYPVRNGRPDRLVEAITTFFPNTESAITGIDNRAVEGGDASVGGSNNNSNNNNNRNNQANRNNQGRNNQNQNNRNANAQQNPEEAARLALEKADVYQTPVTVHADSGLNRIYIKTTPRTYAIISALLDVLDQPVKQVMIQPSAVNVTLTDSLDLGFSYSAARSVGSKNFQHSSGNLINSAPAVIADTGAALNGLSLLLIDGDEFSFVRAIAGKGNTKILFSPQLVTENGVPAEFFVGQNVPFSNGSQTQDNGQQVTNIDYRDVGIILNVEPHITADSRVSLSLYQRISSISTETDVGLGSPVFNENRIQTQLTLNDGDTIIIGGLIRRRNDEITSGIPYLMDIPWLGYLFRGTNRDETKEELLIMLKVKVIENRSDFTQMMKRYHNAVDYLQEVEHDLATKPAKITTK